MSGKIISHYDQHARHYQLQYDSVAAQDVHGHWVRVLDGCAPGQALDVGAGSGRDAAWLASLGWHVTAAEPASGLRELGRERTGEHVHWCNAQLPALENLPVPGNGFDLILLSAVWMHLTPEQRAPSFARLNELLADQGLLIMTLRFGRQDPERPMYEVSAREIEMLACDCGRSFHALSKGLEPDRLSRTDVRWQTVCVAPSDWNPP